MKIAFLGCSSEKQWDALSNSERNAMFEECFSYDKKLVQQGHFVADGVPLQPSRTAKTLRWQDGAAVVTDGPYAETKEQLGGVGVLEVADMAQAVELLSRHPALHYGSAFEIRPINEESFNRQAASLAASSGTARAADPDSSRFASLGYLGESGWGSISEDERAALMKSCIAFDEARIKKGEWRSGIQLQDVQTAKTLRAKAGQVVVTDGPFAETKEQLGGIVILALKDVNAGVAELSRHPALRYGLTIELRPIDAEMTERWETTVNTREKIRC